MAAHIAKWTLVALMAINGLLVVANIGKPRKPTTPGVAAVAIAMVAAQIIAIVLWWHA